MFALKGLRLGETSNELRERRSELNEAYLMGSECSWRRGKGWRSAKPTIIMEKLGRGFVCIVANGEN